MTAPLRIGLLRLADSLPVLIAQELGLFAQAGISADLIVEPSWANVADGLSWNRLDAAVIFPPLAIMTALGKRGRQTALRVVANLSCGGNTIIVKDNNCLTKPAPRFAVVHSYSTHFLLLRHYLAQHCPRALDNLVIMSPDAMLDALKRDVIDGFCAGPPWGVAAEQAGLGWIVSGSNEIQPNHLEKQYVLTEAWAERYPQQAQALPAIMQHSIAHCLDPFYHSMSIDILTRPLNAGGLALPETASRLCMPGSNNPHAFGLPETEKASMDWILSEMRALGWIDQTEDLDLIFTAQ